MATSAPPRRKKPRMSLSRGVHTSASPTALSAFEAIVDDEVIYDVTLQGTDGVRVRASRAFLAARSHVFRNMFYPICSKTTSSTFPLPYRGEVLRSVVDFCYCDKTDFVVHFLTNNTKERLVVGLAAAAHYFELPVLLKRVQDCIAVKMQNGVERFHLACAILDEAMALGPTTQYLVDVALCTIRMNPEKALQFSNAEEYRGILELSPRALVKVIEDREMRTSELLKFRALKTWVEGGSDVCPDELQSESKGVSNGNKEVGGQDAGEETQDRKRLGIDLVSQSIDLTRIATSELRNTVAKSGLVTPEQLAKVFLAQAMLWEKGEDVKKVCYQNRLVNNRYYYVVAGAGMDVANGVYMHWRVEGETATLTKTGSWEEGERVVTLSLKSNNAAKRIEIEISILPESPAGTDRAKRFYFAILKQADKHATLSPPESEWQPASDGVFPTPTMFIVAED